MGMNHQELVLVTGALQGAVGQTVQAVWQPARDRVVLGFSDGQLWLMVPRGPFARVHPIHRRPRNPERPFSFQGACRAHVAGPLVSATVTDGERELTLQFVDARLVLRLTGRSGGLWLLRGDAVLAAYDGPAPSALPELPPRPPRDDGARFCLADDGNWGRAADLYFSDAEARQRLSERRVYVEREIRREIERCVRRKANLEADLDKASEAPLIRKKAELLGAALHLTTRGARFVETTDWDTGEAVVLSLDPAKTAVTQMEAWFTKAGRLERVGDRVLERIDATERELVALRERLSEVATADPGRLETLLPAQANRSAGHAAPHGDVTTWTSPTGARVLIGKNAKGNRRLTFQMSRGHDWWLHLREKPGAHVVIPCPKDHAPALDHLLAAAQIALIAAKVPVGVSQDVQYTRVKDVRSIPGELARVRLANEKVLHVTRDPASLVGWTAS
jgi:predicted ribosome quality control (RQC) complex YloA/Tae2 family protein